MTWVSFAECIVKGNPPRSIPEYLCTVPFLVFMAVYITIALMYIFVPSRMPGGSFWPDLDPNLAKRFVGVFCLIVAVIMIWH